MAEPDDLRLIVTAANDLAYYRTVEGDAGGLPEAVYFELQDRVSKLPEAGLLPAPKQPRTSWRWRAVKLMGAIVWLYITAIMLLDAFGATDFGLGPK